MEKRFLGQNIHNKEYPWKEWQIQSYIVMELRRMGYVVHGDANGASKTPKGISQAKACGMQPGWPDMCIVMDQLIWIELKMEKGRLSDDQKTVHNQLRAAGQTVHVIYADSPASGLKQALEIITGSPSGEMKTQ